MKERKEAEERKQILPLSREIGEEMIKTIYEKAYSRKREGTGDKGGDAYHDEAFLQSEQDFYGLMGRAGQLESLMKGKEELCPPKDNEKIQIGHLVKFSIRDNEQKESISAHLVSEADSLIFLSQSLMGETGKRIISLLQERQEKIISVESLIGRALLGKERGEKNSYSVGGEPVEIAIGESAEAIVVSWLFEN